MPALGVQMGGRCHALVGSGAPTHSHSDFAEVAAVWPKSSFLPSSVTAGRLVQGVPFS